MPVNHSGDVLYGDRSITCTADELLVRGYYAPFGIRKRIPYSAVTGVETIGISPVTGKSRIWGTMRIDRWAHLDPKRTSKHTALLVHTGGRVASFITPDDPDRVQQILAERAGRASDAS
jgi:hypothetical protein